jgi:hypothetical protein
VTTRRDGGAPRTRHLTKSAKSGFAAHVSLVRCFALLIWPTVVEVGARLIEDLGGEVRSCREPDGCFALVVVRLIAGLCAACRTAGGRTITVSRSCWTDSPDRWDKAPGRGRPADDRGRASQAWTMCRAHRAVLVLIRELAHATPGNTPTKSLINTRLPPFAVSRTGRGVRRALRAADLRALRQERRSTADADPGI